MISIQCTRPGKSKSSPASECSPEVQNASGSPDLIVSYDVAELFAYILDTLEHRIASLRYLSLERERTACFFCELKRR